MSDRFKYYDYAYDYDTIKPRISLSRMFAWALNDAQTGSPLADQWWQRIHEEILWFPVAIKVDLQHVEIYRSKWEAIEPIKYFLR